MNLHINVLIKKQALGLMKAQEYSVALNCTTSGVVSPPALHGVLNGVS